MPSWAHWRLSWLLLCSRRAAWAAAEGSWVNRGTEARKGQGSPPTRARQQPGRETGASPLSSARHRHCPSFGSAFLTPHSPIPQCASATLGQGNKNNSRPTASFFSFLIPTRAAFCRPVCSPPRRHRSRPRVPKHHGRVSPIRFPAPGLLTWHLGQAGPRFIFFWRCLSSGLCWALSLRPIRRTLITIRALVLSSTFHSVGSLTAWARRRRFVHCYLDVRSRPRVGHSKLPRIQVHRLWSGRCFCLPCHPWLPFA